MTPEPGPAVVELLRAQIDIALNAVDALDRKLALLIPFLGTVAALLLPDPIAASQFALATAAGSITLIAAGFSIWGLAGTAISIGPEQAWLAGQTKARAEDFYHEVANRQRMSVDAMHDVTRTKSRRFNFALVAASAAMLLFLAVRLIPAN